MRPIGHKNLGHISFHMRNSEEMLRFYRDILGMKEQFTLTFEDLLPVEAKTPEELLRLLPEDADEARKAFLLGLWKKRDRKWMTYLKLAGRQYVELFYPTPSMHRVIENRWGNFGYTKMNLEVASIEDMRKNLLDNGIRLRDDIHWTVDGSLELRIRDPDGNEVQITEYPKDGKERIPMKEEPDREVVSRVSYITKVAYQVKDAPGMIDFYANRLGFRVVERLTVRDLAEKMAEAGGRGEMLEQLKLLRDRPWIEFLEVAPHQYIELFHVLGSMELGVDRNLSDAFGYQHICIEVEDIHEAWDAVIANGLTPDEPIRLGAAKAWQFWLTDPDGNRLELMQYGPDSLQLRPR